MAPLSLFSVEDTLGAAFIGFNVSCIVFGIMTTQVFTYFRNYPLDRRMYKGLVYTLWLLELMDQVFIGYSIYYYNISHFRNPLELLTQDIIPTLVLQIVIGCLVGTIVKVCFAMRVWRFSKRNVFITGTIALMIITQFGFALYYVIRAFQINRLLMADQLRVVASLALGTGLITDVTIALSLCYLLKKMRTGYRKTDNIVNTLCVYAVNTGALTGAVGVVTILLYNIRPDTFFFMASYFTLGKLYAISFLATLNTRRVSHGRGTDRQDSTNNTSAAYNVYNGGPGRLPRHQDIPLHPLSPTKSLEIDVHQEVSVKTDHYLVEEQEVLPYLPQRIKQLGYKHSF